MARHSCFRIFAAAAAALTAGCLFSPDQRVAGGAEDFPNTIEPVGAAVSDDISGQSDWDQFANIPATLPSFKGTDTLALQPGGALALKAASGAPKTASAAALTDTVWDKRDTATLGVARRIINQFWLLKARHDTTTFRYDAQFLDSIAGNELALDAKGVEASYNGARVQTYHYFNLDSAGGFDSAAFYLRQRGIDSIYHNYWYSETGGPDGDIVGQADNLPAFYAYARIDFATGKPDTLESFEITDADGDGRLWGAGDSGVVEFRQKRTDPPARPTVKVAVQKMRALLFKDELKTYPISFSEMRVDKDGKKVVFAVRGSRPDSIPKGVSADSTFGPGDTVFVSVHTSPPDGSRVLQRDARFSVLLSATPKRFDQNQLLTFSLTTLWRDSVWTKGGVKRTHVRFVPDQPVLSQNLSLAAGVDADIEFADGSSGQVTGRFLDKLIDGVFTEKGLDNLERKFQVQWDVRDGHVLLQKKL